MIYLICDDVSEAEFYKLERLREEVPHLRVNCFVMGKDAGDYLKRDWVEVGVHGWDHTCPPECERGNQRDYILKGLNALKPYIPKRFGFRAPGFQMTASTYPILLELGFYFIAHQTRIQALKGRFSQGDIINVHVYDKDFGGLRGTFGFLSDGLN